MTSGDEKTWWIVTGTVTVSAWTMVRAATREEAIEACKDAPNGGLAPSDPGMNGVDPTEEFVIEEADGSLTPTDARPADADDLRRYAPEDDEDQDDEP